MICCLSLFLLVGVSSILRGTIKCALSNLQALVGS